jgi:tetratricopeptide (TPR) repeat protein
MVVLSRLALASAVAWLVGASSPAWAEGPAASDALFEQGERLYNLGEYRQALEAFKAAYQLDRQRAYLFAVAQCHRKLGERELAISAYKAFLREDPPPEERIEATDWIAKLTEAPPPLAPRAPLQPPLRAEATAPVDVPRPRPLLRRPWVWAVAGGLLAGAIATTVWALQRGPGGIRCPECDLETVRLSKR